MHAHTGREGFPPVHPGGASGNKLIHLNPFSKRHFDLLIPLQEHKTYSPSNPDSVLGFLDFCQTFHLPDHRASVLLFSPPKLLVLL